LKDFEKVLPGGFLMEVFEWETTPSIEASNERVKEWMEAHRARNLVTSGLDERLKATWALFSRKIWSRK
jgi:hypothetical protein